MMEKTLNWGIAIFAGLLPLFFLPLTAEFYEFNKNILLFIGTAILLVLWLATFLLKKELRFVQTPLDWGIILIVLTFILANLFASTNKIGAFTAPGGTATFLLLGLIYFVVSNNLTRPKLLLNSIVVSASILALISIYQFAGLGELLIPVDWLKVKSWTPFGSLLSLTGFLGLALTIIIPRLIREWRQRNSQFPPSLIWQFFASLLLVISLLVCLFQLFTSAKPLLLPYRTSWYIAGETLKNQPLLGVGPDNYLAAFGRGRPVSLNLGNLWNVRFNKASNVYLQILTTLGILGLGSWVWLIFELIKTFKRNPLSLPLGFLLLFFLFFPLDLTLMATFFLLLAFAGNSPVGGGKKEARLATQTGSQILFGMGLLLCLGIIYGSARLWLADFYFRKSLLAINQNKGDETYNLQIKAITLNPYQENYRLIYSQTNLALANSITASAPTGELSDQDRQTVSQLVQQAIREAKVATSLSPYKVTNWENLARLYRSLMNFAEGAADWTLASYNQAVALDPTNPALRLNYGGVFYALKNYDEAINQFKIAANLKPDYANAYYNLAAGFREKGLLNEAITALKRTQALVSFDSNDWQTVAQEIKDLQAKLPPEEIPAETETTPETLTEPAVPPEVIITPPLELPEEASPEINLP
jgi:tetratricopeptide (TPR) repeat protein